MTNVAGGGSTGTVHVEWETLVATVVGILALLVFLLFTVRACSNSHDENQRNRRDVQLACVQAGHQWVQGNCVWGGAAP